jgi:lipid-binding SYLF domain-containing protein
VLTLPFLPLALAEMMADRTDPDRTPPDVMIPADEIRNCQGLAFMWTYKVGMFLSFSAGNGMVIRKRKGSGGDIEWSLPCAISFGGAGGGLDFGAACSSTVVVLNTKEAVEYFSGQHVKAGVRRAGVRGAGGTRGGGCRGHRTGGPHDRVEL